MACSAMAAMIIHSTQSWPRPCRIRPPPKEAAMKAMDPHMRTRPNWTPWLRAAVTVMLSPSAISGVQKMP